MIQNNIYFEINLQVKKQHYNISPNNQAQKQSYLLLTAFLDLENKD